MTVMVTPCLLYVVWMRSVMSYVKFPQAPCARAPFGECRKNRCDFGALSCEDCRHLEGQEQRYRWPYLQGSFGPSGRSPKKVSKRVLGPLGAGGPKKSESKTGKKKFLDPHVFLGRLDSHSTPPNSVESPHSQKNWGIGPKKCHMKMALPNLAWKNLKNCQFSIAFWLFVPWGREAPRIPFETFLGLRAETTISQGRKKRKIARSGPVFWPKNSFWKSLCGSLFCVLSQKMRHTVFFLGVQTGAGAFWVGG